MSKTLKPERVRKGLQTRERLLGAAIAEFKRTGMAAADVGAIVAAAGVAHATFYFHFPTKEHVLLELERREQERMAAELIRFFRTDHDVRATLSKTVDVLKGLEHRLGARLFKDFLALHFSTTRPPSEEWTSHPVIVAVVEELRRAQARGQIPPGVDVMLNGVSFLVGLYALLITMPESWEIRRPVIDVYLTTYLHGLRALDRE
ncbi:TetR family transcriptional regulator [Mycolicibacterium phlei]|uniref:TetR family transcriptional regulator n=1 Tax=Mycolicibacterium phlei DSM 43239 = CCUG 21000 TaxID=1226750 RepID=A0A5N5UZD3_MYCPH|nr:TetR/AcrR family transcriptional regulator [Mycolicibacterium phlei]VEG11918.1 TetR family transcriptional regulator [Mycobacteroides chelonae]AMO63827.1 DNA-binding transcriptional repressor AcrR [Mycolicibacterium phlei]KAB7754778.1 TetR family transcriptional regulator [Mycolicibacterium phlei DSM 43239 = CCUG 21000]KXW65423.1 TetR family transcriptional regulator [Mycolicibacterium phlei DSM 43239 = CCUG 21000]KXW69458.1 TetR family transcriptional regulator [Mycolicibacterium phlei DSM